MKYLFLLILIFLAISSCTKKYSNVDDSILPFVGRWIEIGGAIEITIESSGKVKTMTACGESELLLIGNTDVNNSQTTSSTAYRFKVKNNPEFVIVSNASFDTVVMYNNTCELVATTFKYIRK